MHLGSGREWWRMHEEAYSVANLRSRPPPLLHQAVLEGLREAMNEVHEVGSLDNPLSGPLAEQPEVPEHWRDLLAEGGGFWDDVNGVWLEPMQVIKARELEIDWIHKEQVYRVVPRAQAEADGIKPLGLLWVDTDKTHGMSEAFVRSRLCVREYNGRGQEERSNGLCPPRSSSVPCLHLRR